MSKNNLRTLLIIFFFVIQLFPQQSAINSALLIIDVQNFYFSGGSAELVDPIPASINAKKLLHIYREKNLPVIHIRHNVKSGGEIHNNVEPIKNEKIISKNYANSFRDTELNEFLKSNKISNLIICGMQTHMCVEAATRAGADLGYECTVIHDACATRDLKFQDYTVKAIDVHNSTLSSLKSYAKIVDTNTFLKSIK